MTSRSRRAHATARPPSPPVAAIVAPSVAPRAASLAARLGPAACLVLVACGAPQPSTSGAGASGGAGGGEGGGAGAPILDPSLFDCTATEEPTRASPVPLACTVDPTCTERLVCGHRGSGGQLGVLAPENSLASVRAAIALGVDLVETDPRETADGVLVNVHDTDVDRVAHGTGEVSELTFAELSALALRSEAYAGDFSCERIATIEEVLLVAKGQVAVLLDANKTSRIDLLVQAIHATDTRDIAVIDTSSVDKIDEALALDPSLLTMIRVSSEAELDAALSHFADHPPIIVEVSGGSYATLAPLILAAGHRPFTDAFAVDALAALDDAPEYYEPVWATGVQILQTDRPDLVLRSLGR